MQAVNCEIYDYMQVTLKYSEHTYFNNEKKYYTRHCVILMPLSKQ
jgi:hypothetical protein